MRDWLLRPHVRRWWDESEADYPETTLVRYRAAIRNEIPTSRFLAHLEDAPIGLIQYYRISDHQPYGASLGLAEDAVGIDLFIGEERFLHLGHGPRLLRAFLAGVAFPSTGLALSVIHPAITNVAAIRAYEKAGYAHLGTVHAEGDALPGRLMAIRRDEAVA